MRLDKFIAENTGLTRSQAAKALKSGLVTVNDEIVKSGSVKITEQDQICYEGNILCFTNHKAIFVRMMMVNIQPFINFLIIR